MSRLVFAALVWGVAGALLAASPQAWAQDAADLENSRRAHALSSEVMSPYCPGRTLTDCPSPDAAVLRTEIRRLVASGVSEEAIRLDLDRRFGSAVRGVPGSAWGWGLPILMLAVGAGVLAIALVRISRARGSQDAPPAPSAEAAAKLDAELRSRGL